MKESSRDSMCELIDQIEVKDSISFESELGMFKAATMFMCLSQKDPRDCLTSTAIEAMMEDQNQRSQLMSYQIIIVSLRFEQVERQVQVS